MKIKIYLMSLLLALFTINVNAQITNLNPDPDGDPWIAGDLPEITPEIHIMVFQFIIQGQMSLIAHI